MFSDEHKYRNNEKPAISRRTILTGLGIAAGLYMDKKFLGGAVINGAEKAITSAVDTIASPVISNISTSKKDSSENTEELEPIEPAREVPATPQRIEPTLLPSRKRNNEVNSIIPIVDGSKAKPAGVSLEGLLKISDNQNLYGDQIEALELELYKALEYGVNRIGVAPAAPFNVVIEPGESLNGFTILNDPKIGEGQRLTQVYVGPSDRDKIDGPVQILAHEFIHQICNDALNDKGAEISIAEGIANWGSLKYWVPAEDIKGYIQQFYTQRLIWPMFGQDVTTKFLEARENPILPNTVYMVQIYYQWTGWCDFLINEYGKDKFRELYPTGDYRNMLGNSDYEGVYKVSRSVLEDQWKDEWLQS